MRAVVGTRAAMFAPVQKLGLVVVWEDGDASHSDDNAPFPHVREVLELRATQDKCAFLLGSTSCTVEAAQLVQSGWAAPLAADRTVARAAAPLVRTVGDGELARDEAARAARLPSLAWQAVQGGPEERARPRAGAEKGIRAAAGLRALPDAGPVRPLRGPPGGAGRATRCAARWCGTAEADWHCAECGATRLRAQIVGARRTAEELGRAFPAVPVRTSGRDHVLDAVPAQPALVVSTPGAEPVAEGGYAAALLLDGWAMLGRPDLRAGEEALRRWITAASLVRGQDEGGTVVVVAEPTLRPVQALVRWDPVGHALRELAERAELGFPPVSRMAEAIGRPEAVEAFVRSAQLPPDAQVLGPVPLPLADPGRPRRPGDPPVGEQWERVLLRVPPGSGAALAAALKAAQAARLARGGGDPVRIRIDPPDIG